MVPCLAGSGGDCPGSLLHEFLMWEEETGEQAESGE